MAEKKTQNLLIGHGAIYLQQKHSMSSDPLDASTKVATYSVNKQEKVEVACVKLNRSFEYYLQHVGGHYPAERKPQGCLKGRERLRTVALHGRMSSYSDYPQFVANWIVHDTKSNPKP
ncbi:hypothetical protein TNCV_4172421 [Trichonephila clavipes]|nr:hypothetical protein TNCV_4172421 [Trichonephila clavipes]